MDARPYGLNVVEKRITPPLGGNSNPRQDLRFLQRGYTDFYLVGYEAVYVVKIN
jgi:hypothetical protein